MGSPALHLDQYNLDNLKHKKTLCLIDGEHYPPVIKRCIKVLESKSVKVRGLFLLGGTEKISGLKEVVGKEYNLIRPDTKENLLHKFETTLQKNNIEIVLDLSDEPVIDYRSRFRLACYTLKHNKYYIGADFTFSPPEQKDILTKPSISIIGTGKRIGKTALGIETTRILHDSGIKPIIVCMGRGGPPQPEVVHADERDITVDSLFEELEQGKHAASDYWEEAIFSSTKTIGCHRCGGGLAGNPVYSNVIEGAHIANQVQGNAIIMEGSGPTFPPVNTDKNITLIGANQPLWKIFGYFGLYRIMLADLIIITCCEPPLAEKEKIKKIRKKISILKPETEIIPTVFRPYPRRDITGKKVFIATSGSNMIQNLITDHLEDNYNCKIQGYTNNLSNRTKLSQDLENGLKNSEVLLTEVKAAAIDTAAKRATELNIEVDFIHNSPRVIENDQSKLKEAILSLYQSI